MPRARPDGVSARGKRECALPLPFRSILTLDRLDDARSVRMLLSLLSRALINLFRKHPRRPVPMQSLPAVWVSVSLAELTHKISRHRHPLPCSPPLYSSYPVSKRFYCLI